MAKKATKENIEETFAHFEEVNDDKSGFEGITLETMSIPFIKILQDLSPQMKKSKPEFIPEAEAGMLINSVSEKLYASPLKVVIGKFERYFIEWKANRGPFVASHLPEDIETNAKLMRDENYRLFDPATNNTFSDTYIYYALMPDFIEEGICIISLTSSGIKEAKKLNRNLMSTIIPGTARRALPYFMIWDFNVVEMSNDKGSWYGPKFMFNSFVTQNQLTHVVNERKTIPNKTLDLKMLEEDKGEESSFTDDPKY